MGEFLELGLAAVGAVLLALARGRMGARPGRHTVLVPLAACALGVVLLVLGAPIARALRATSATLLGLSAVALGATALGPLARELVPPHGGRGVAAVAFTVAGLAPWPLLRAAGLGVLFLLVIGPERRLVSSARVTGLFFFLVLILALALPAWRRSDEARGVLLGLSGLGALLLALLAAKPLTLAVEPSGAAWPASLALGPVLLLERGPLEGPFAWRGDEDHHVCRAQAALELWTFERGFVGLLAVALAASVLARLTRRASVVFLGALAAGALAGLLAIGRSGDEGRLIPLDRYLPLQAWIHGVLAFAPATLPFPSLRFAEGWYRLAPLVALLAAVTVVARRAPLDAPCRLLAGLALATVPSLHFHATLLYLEVPLVLLLAFVLIEHGRHARGSSLSEAVLLVVPFLKETALPAFLVLGGRAALAARREGGREVVRRLLITVIPVVLVVFLRKPGIRPFVPHGEALLSATLWARVPSALFEQAGGLVLLAPVGAFFAWRRGRADHALLALAVFLGTLVFLALDGEAYFGLARFFLLLLPPLLALGFEAVLGLGRLAAAAVLATLVATNLLLSPVGLDGARRPFFGEPQVASGELVYPWPDALELLAPLGEGAEVVVLGQSYAYPYDLYARRHGVALALRVEPFPPDALQRALDRRRAGLRGPDPRDQELLRGALARAAPSSARALVLQLLPGDDDPWPERAGARVRRASLALGECRLLVYE